MEVTNMVLSWDEATVSIDYTCCWYSAVYD